MYVKDTGLSKTSNGPPTCFKGVFLMALMVCEQEQVVWMFFLFLFSELDQDRRNTLRHILAQAQISWQRGLITIAIEHRMAELKVRNTETPSWQTFYY